MKTLNELKTELVSKELLTQEAADNADTKVLKIEAEWDNEDNIIVKSKQIGVYGNDTIFKAIAFEGKLPATRKDEDYEVTESNFKSDIQAMYLDCEIWLRID